jgi:hypothetical protein
VREKNSAGVKLTAITRVASWALDERRNIDLHVSHSSWGIDRLFHIILNANNCAMLNVHVPLHDRRVKILLLTPELELLLIGLAARITTA